MSTTTLVEPKLVRSPTDTPPPVARLTELGYFERARPVRIILGSFVFLTLPIAAMVLLLPDSFALNWLYIWLFGGTHIVLTLTIYASRANRRYFTSSPRNLAVFVAIPLALLGSYFALNSLELGKALPWVAIAFWAGLRFFNFFHLNRQSFGVHQLFKARTKAKFPGWAKRTENGTGLALVATLMVTHAAGGVCPLLTESTLGLRIAWLGCAGVALALFSASMVALFRARSSPDAPGFRAAMLYFTLQNLGTAAATLYIPLYLASLAMHYVEYHVLMVPRIAKQELDPASASTVATAGSGLGRSVFFSRCWRCRRSSRAGWARWTSPRPRGMVQRRGPCCSRRSMPSSLSTTSSKCKSGNSAIRTFAGVWPVSTSASARDNESWSSCKRR